MSDEKPENQEFYSSNEVNDFHSSTSARELSASSSTSETSDTAETATTTASTAAPVTAGVVTSGAVATVAVTVGVLSGTPLLTNLPKVELLEAETTSTSVSYSFQCTYVTAGSLIVRLTSASETKDNSYDLTVPMAESSTPSGLKKADATSSAPGSSESPVSSSSSSTSYTKQIEGSFAGLSPNTNYVLTILSSFTSNSLTTIKTETLETPDKPTIIAGTMDFASAAIDDAKASFAYHVSLNDPSATFDTTSYNLQIAGKGLDGLDRTTTNPISDIGADQTASLATFKGSQSLTFSLMAISSYAAEGETAKTTSQIFASKCLYYAGVAPTASFAKSIVDDTVETFTYQLSVTDDCALLLKESLTIYVNGTDKAGSPLTEEHAVDLTSSGDQSFSIANFKGSESLSITLMGISSYAIEGATPSKEPVPLASLTPYYAGTQAVITFVTSTVDYTTSTLSYSISVTDPSSVLDTTSVYLIAANSDGSITQKGTFTGSLTDTQTLSLSSFTKGNFLRLGIWGISSYAKEGDTAPSTAQKFVEKALYY
jgi:hypothetical protein